MMSIEYLIENSSVQYLQLNIEPMHYAYYSVE